MDYVYMVKCSDNTYYTGWTTDPAHRLATHNAGKGAKYTRPRLPVTLIYLEQQPSKSAALSRENAIKKLTRQEKDILVATYKKSTSAYPEFTPLCWISWSEEVLSNITFGWKGEDAVENTTTAFSVLMDLSDYPISFHIKPKKSSTKKENL